MDIRIRFDPIYEEYYHFHMLIAGRTGFYRYASPLTLLLFAVLVFTALFMSFLNGIAADELFLFFLFIPLALTVFIILYVIPPRTIKKLFHQYKNISGSHEYRFTENSVGSNDERGESTIPWGKYVKWLEDDKVLVLFQTDAMINLIPKRCLSREQMDEIRQAITTAKIPVHRVRHIGAVLWMVFVVFVMAPTVCLITLLSLYSFILSSAGF
ncbi:MAG: YcxB family protein [Anaerolineales bacterium]